MHVAAGRLVRWVGGFTANHGPLRAEVTAAGLDLTAADGAVARVATLFLPWVPPGPEPFTDVADLVVALARHTERERRLAVLLVRRGGYACALLAGERIEQSKVGSRYVQGRTAAGGWSQQRFARRRENQTGELAGAAALHAVRVLLPGLPVEALVTGGDTGLVDRVLTDPRLRALAQLPRGPHLAIGDPRADVLRAVPASLQLLDVQLTDPVPGPSDADRSSG